MLAGEAYLASDPELVAARAQAQALLERLNATAHADQSARTQLLRELLGELGDGAVVELPFRCDYGSHISIGAGTFINYDCVVLDPAPVSIGRDCQIATRVQLITATHPLDAAERRAGWESGAAIALEDDVWLGAGVIVMPGVRIGAGTVVGAGAVVSRSLPPGVLATGVPARIRRELSP